MKESPMSILKPLLFGVLVIGGFGLGAYQCVREDVDRIGDLGMTRSGREIYCQTVAAQEKPSPDFHFQCEGFFTTLMVLSIGSTKTPAGELSFANMDEMMKRPYSAVIDSFLSITLRTETERDREKTLTIDKIRKKLDSLGVRTFGGFYASCGFDKLIVRNEKTGEVLMEYVFRSEKTDNK